jgi:tetratricopeptide (TPR) repeat protein
MNLLNQANIEFNNGKFEASKVILLEILSREHRNIEALQLLGIIYANEQNLIKSIEIFTKAIKFNPINPQLLFNRGNALNESGKHEEAMVDFEKSLLLDSKNVKTLVAYGNALKHCGYIKKALDSYDSALKINPQFYEAILYPYLVMGTLRPLDFTY